jgi:hypothetical protein
MIQTDVYVTLAGNEALAELVSGRIYPRRLPQSVIVPAVVYTINEITPVRSLAGESGLDNGTVEIICWAKEYSKAQFVANAVRAAFIASGFTILTGQMQDVEDPDTRNFGVLMRMSAWSYNVIPDRPDAPSGGLLARIVAGETPTPAVDGSQTVFTTAHPYVAWSLKVTRGTLRMYPGVDFTETSPTTFTMTVAPESNEPLIVDYIKK